VRHRLRLKSLSLRLPCNEIVAEQGHRPSWVSKSFGLLRFATAYGDTHVPGWVFLGQFS
jgi:hypothetical protein